MNSKNLPYLLPVSDFTQLSSPLASVLSIFGFQSNEVLAVPCKCSSLVLLNR